MKDLDKMIKEYHNLKDQAENLKREIFSDITVDVLKERIILLCEQIMRGREEPQTCSEQYSIPSSIARKKDMELSDPLFHYDINECDFEIIEDRVKILLESWFRGELDSSYEFNIPLVESSFNKYLREESKAANEREQKVKVLKAVEDKKQKNLELQLLRELKAKYEIREKTSH